MKSLQSPSLWSFNNWRKQQDLPLAFLKLSNAAAQFLLTQQREGSPEGLLEIQADSLKHITLTHISCFKELQAHFHRNQGYLLQCPPFLPLSMDVPVPSAVSQSSAITHTHTVSIATHLHMFLLKGIFFIRETNLLLLSVNISPSHKQNAIKHGTSTFQKVRRQKMITGGLNMHGLSSFPQSFCFPWWSFDLFLSHLLLLFLPAFLSVSQK